MGPVCQETSWQGNNAGQRGDIEIDRLVCWRRESPGSTLQKVNEGTHQAARFGKSSESPVAAKKRVQLRTRRPIGCTPRTVEKVTMVTKDHRDAVRKGKSPSTINRLNVTAGKENPKRKKTKRRNLNALKETPQGKAAWNLTSQWKMRRMSPSHGKVGAAGSRSLINQAAGLKKRVTGFPSGREDS